MSRFDPVQDALMTGSEPVEDASGSRKRKLDETSPGKPMDISSLTNPVQSEEAVAGQSKKKKLNKSGHQAASSSAGAGNAKLRHLKKPDGRPFTRSDIQFEFLNELFNNKTAAFTDPLDPANKLTFKDIYTQSIAYSSKCSKILKDRFLNEPRMSIPTTMICLLVNVGRMNTTINFVPDMKSQLRTYHSIPCLQLSGKDNEKQLQDTPRLKSILKACCDDNDPVQNDLAKLRASTACPKTNIINAIFLLCASDEYVQKQYFSGLEYTIFDIFLSSEYKPRDRSLLFLWILYDVVEQGANPFGDTQPVLGRIDDGVKYDTDTQEEIEFGERMYSLRTRILQEEAESENSAAERDRDPDREADKELTSSPSPVQKLKFKIKPVLPQQIVSQSTTYEPIENPERCLKMLDILKERNYQRRQKQGQLLYEHHKIMDELLNTPTSENASVAASVVDSSKPKKMKYKTKLKLSNYTGDYVENTDSEIACIDQLKEFQLKTAPLVQQHVPAVEYTLGTDSIALKEFRLVF